MSRAQRLMRALEETSPYFIRREIDEMSVEEAREIWEQVKRFRPLVASWAGAGSRKGMRYLLTLRKMRWLEEKANGGKPVFPDESEPEYVTEIKEALY